MSYLRNGGLFLFFTDSDVINNMTNFRVVSDVNITVHFHFMTSFPDKRIWYESKLFSIATTTYGRIKLDIRQL